MEFTCDTIFPLIPKNVCEIEKSENSKKKLFINNNEKISVSRYGI